jgi:hypothetical protein
MATNFPTSLDTLVNPLPGDNVNAPSHAAQHTNANDAIEALEQKVGITNSAVTTTHDYRISQVEAFANNLGNTLGDYVPLGDVGQADGVASLDSSGYVPDTQIDSTIARTSDISTAISNLIDGAPAALDTLNELAAALNDDENYATTVTTALSGKAPLASPALTGTPTAPTAASGTSTTQIATTAYVQDSLAMAMALAL